MRALRRPRALPPGGTIGIAAPAGPIDAERLEEGEAALRAAGYAVRRRDDLTARRGYLAGDDARRAGELMELVDDPGIDAILCARGGYGCHRIVARLHAERMRAAAKPLIGYSDITTLLLWQRRCAGLVGFHGPMLERGGGIAGEPLRSLAAALGPSGAEPVWLSGRPGGGGRAEGPLVGGGLALVVASLGTPWEIETRGAILLLEEVNERPFRIDRMLQQLRAAGRLDEVAGVGFGSLEGCEDPSHPAPSALQVIEEVVAPLGVPLVTGLPFGHGKRNLPWPVGVRAAIDGERGEVVALERGVEAGA